MRTFRAGRPGAMLAMCAVGALTLSGCSGKSPISTPGAGGDGSSNSSSSSSTPQATPAAFSFTPASGASDVRPDKQVSVQASTGTLSSVVVKDAKGNSLPGSLNSGTWTSSSRLKPDTTYRITATGAGPDGTSTTKTSTFTTLTPKVTATYGVFYDGSTVGVGMPATIQFDSEVTDKAYRQKVEKAVKITTSPHTEGSWGWLDNRQLMWRPKNYWKPGTTVTVSAPLTGYQTGDNKWIAKGSSATFHIGDSRISYVDMNAHTMTVTKNGKTVRVIPVSTGKNEPRFVTRYGTKVIITKEGDVTMDSATVGIPKGDPNYYKLTTHSNLRVTWTGEYLHSAPWSVGSQGSANVSHGCTNMSPGNAEWMFNFSEIGDVVKFTGSNRPFLPTEGIGVWQYSYKEWQKQSALYGTSSVSSSSGTSGSTSSSTSSSGATSSSSTGSGSSSDTGSASSSATSGSTDSGSTSSATETP